MVVPISDYNATTGKTLALGQGQALLLGGHRSYGSDSISVLGQTYAVTPMQEEFVQVGMSQAYNTDPTLTYTLVVPGISDLESLKSAYERQEGEGSKTIRYMYGFDLGISDDQQAEVAMDLFGVMSDAGIQDYYFEGQSLNRTAFLQMYGGLFFLGIFLTFVFLLATVLIIYYKQISEGYDDQRRYAIMQKVGLSRKEARRAINAQILTMFFLPLVVACIHLAFAFPALVRLLYVMNLYNVGLFILCAVLCILAFSLFYMAVYRLTAKVYYRLVEQRPS